MQTTKVNEYTLTWLQVADLKALWLAMNIPKGSCPFCMCNSVAVDRSIVGGWKTWSRCASGALSKFTLQNIGVCTLHMKLRMTEILCGQ